MRQKTRVGMLEVKNVFSTFLVVAQAKGTFREESLAKTRDAV